MTLMSIEKGFFVKNMKDKYRTTLLLNELSSIEVSKIEHDESQKEFQRGLDHALTNFKGSIGPCLTRKQKKEKTKT
jgi:hypothetical protein